MTDQDYIMQSHSMHGDAVTAVSTGSTDFEHQQYAHCESGVLSAMLRATDLPMTEAMAFGLASGLSFAYLPFIKINQLPLIAYRMPPRFLIKSLQRLLKLPFRFETFRDADKGKRRLDELLAQGKLVGLQTSVYFLPYFPPAMRFHFNAHNLLAYGKDGDDYLISDPVFEQVKRCASADLQKARFVRGVLAPKGLLYYLDGPVQAPDLKPLLRTAMIRTCRIMLHTPAPFIGSRGIRFLANRLPKLAGKYEADYVRRYVGHVVRMQEEIGTGGAGFRFLYAAFLQQAAQLLGDERLATHAAVLTRIGDDWREFALAAARMNKGRMPVDLPLLQQHLLKLAEQETAFFRELLKLIK